MSRLGFSFRIPSPGQSVSLSSLVLPHRISKSAHVQFASNIIPLVKRRLAAKRQGVIRRPPVPADVANLAQLRNRSLAVINLM